MVDELGFAAAKYLGGSGSCARGRTFLPRELLGWGLRASYEADGGPLIDNKAESLDSLRLEFL